MELQFVITINEHRKFGNIFAPYFLKKEQSPDYNTIYERVTTLNLSKYGSLLSPEEVQLVKIIEEYNEQNLQKLFSKKKVSLRDFIASITQELLESQIKPFIERRMARCVEILSFNPVPLYYKILQTNIYESDRIKEVNTECSAVFNFIKIPEGLRYFLSMEYNGSEIKLTGKEGTILVNSPCHVLIDNRLFVFPDIDSKKISPFFSKEFISIPKSAERKFLEGFVSNAIKKYKVHAEGFIIEDKDSLPKPLLSVETDLNGRLFIILKFIYNNKQTYFANKITDLKVECKFTGDDVHFTCLKRNFEYENEYISRLLALGMINKEGAYFQPLLKDTGTDKAAYSIINWINYNSNAIQNGGFDISQDKLDKSYYLNDLVMKMEVSEKNNDWFDINAIVEFDGFKIPFAKFYTHILNDDRIYELPDGRILILPEEWFESYRDILSFSKVDKDTITLDKQHFPLLNRNFNGSTDHFAKGLRSLLESGRKQEELPENINASVRNYQVDGYSWLYCLYKNGFGGCLADDMGLGKTLQTLILLKRVIAEVNKKSLYDANQDKKKSIQLSLFENIESPAKILKTSLVVVPTSLVHNWLNEASRFVPDLVIKAYTGSQRKDLKDVFATSDIVITSYGILRNDLEEFLPLDFLYLILDESQTIKNPGSKTYQAVMQIKAENRLTLTGTPIENSLTDLWSQLNFLNPGLLGSLNFFKAEFQIPIEKNGDDTKRARLQQLITPFVLRRSKSEVATDLPPINEQVVFCNLDEQQEEYYEKEKSKTRNFVMEKMASDGYNKSAVIILQSLTRLRQIANHPLLVDENYFGGSGKFDEITRNLESIKAEGHKALIFSSFVKHLDLLAGYLQKQNVKYAWLTGETKEKDRGKVIDEFQKDTDCSFFLISLKAGGVGLNLTAADYVFILDPWWNPKAELQAIGRAHRIGQDKNVFVYRFIARNTLEEKIIKLQERKSKLADAFINENLHGITQDQVMELFD